MKPVMLAFAIMMVFTFSTVLAQTEAEREAKTERALDRARDMMLCVSPAGYQACDSNCRGEYERCLRQAANADDKQCRGEYEACERICDRAYCEE